MNVAFLTASRADYGKIKPVILEASKNKINYIIFVTGSHLLDEYGKTINQIKKDFKSKKIISFRNQKFGDSQQKIFTNTVDILTKILRNKKFDCFFIHGDRVETLAAASVLTFSKIKIAHIEGGELSGTVDEMIRHSVSKLSHIHFVSNTAAKKVLINSGESKENVFITGSPDIDLLNKSFRPDLNEVKKKYALDFKDYIISFLHPVTTETKNENKKNAKIYFQALLKLKNLGIVQFAPNNDDHSLVILKCLNNAFKKKNNVRILQSMRFEYYLTLLENCKFIIGNSSSAIMEAPYFGVPAINVGNRQINRHSPNEIINVPFKQKNILNALKRVHKKRIKINSIFGKGNSSKKIIQILRSKRFKELAIQKIYSNLR
ncbi:MAG: UDP-N-acetylglucosamine 2-epimerase (hydrolyzing) [Euryarchaeota archaeon]|nr:UDP-N-acetylglucosamine 2-epimerase (hydrolyzing) [Euryarchaeota archaeon]|tara:strand:+ start:201 stop:1328 length:1128 start_codon:yes stop_codon:yes gene_type:complete